MPPPPPPIEDGIDGDSEAMCSMLMAWYMSGYHTGYYQVQFTISSGMCIMQNVLNINISTFKYIHAVSDFVCYRIGEAVLFTGNRNIFCYQIKWNGLQRFKTKLKDTFYLHYYTR